MINNLWYDLKAANERLIEQLISSRQQATELQDAAEQRAA